MNPGIVALVASEHTQDDEVKAAVFESVLDCLVAMDSEGTIFEFNPAAEKTFGYSRAEAMGKKVEDLIIPPRYREAHRKGLARYSTTRSSEVVGQRILIDAMRADGSEFPIELAITQSQLAGRAMFTGVIRDVSEEKAAAGRLSESQRLLAATQAASHIGSFELNLVTGGMTWSDEQFRIFGHEPASLSVDYSAFLDCIHPDDRERIDAGIRAGEPDCEAFVMECRTLRPDGTIRWIHGWGEFLSDTDTRTRLLASVQDITERLTMELDLRASSKLFEGAFTAAKTGIALIGADSRTYIDVNDALCELLGYSKEELMALDWVAVTHPDDRQVNIKVVEDFAVGTEKVKFVRKRYVRKNGDVISVEISEAVVREPGGKPMYYVSHITDVTDRERSAQDLKKSQELLKAVIDNSPAAIYIKGADGRYLMANSVFLRSLGLQLDEVIGHTAHDIFPAELADSFAAGDHDVQIDGPMRVEEKAPHADGTLHDYISVKFPLTNEGLETEVCGISTDVTDLVGAQDEKKRLEGQLRQAQKMEAVGQLAGGVAHDFNNILSVILNYAEFVAEDLDVRDTRRADVQQIITASEKAAKLVHQLLTFSRKEIIEPRVVDLGEVVRGVEELLRRSIGEDIGLEIVTPRGLWLTKSDTSQLEQILMNLVVNARDAMPDGGDLQISTTNESILEGDRIDLSAGRYACLTVTDSGAGMDADTTDRIFEPFFTTKARDKGTGLGLSTVYGIVQQAEGGVYVDSRLGGGTTFSVYLPATDEVSAARTVDRLPADPLGASATVLVVEDEEVVRTLVSRILTKNGFDVVAVSSGATALEYCRTNDDVIDLLLTDVVMPEMSGKTLADHLAAERDIKVLYMSGYTDEIIAKRGVLASNEDLIEKPFTSQALVAKVRSVLHRARRHPLPALD